MSQLSAPTPDATTLSKGKVQLAGNLGGTAVSPTVTGAQTNAITAAALATSAIYLGSTLYTTADITTTATSGAPATATAVAVTVTVPAGSRRTKITFSGALNNSTAGQSNYIAIWRGTVGTGTLVKGGFVYCPAAGADNLFSILGIDSPSAGSVTYNIGWYVTGGTGSLKASTTEQLLNLVEAL
jgi:hypothetical protein